MIVVKSWWCELRRGEEGQLGVDPHSRAVRKHLELSEELTGMLCEEARGV